MRKVSWLIAGIMSFVIILILFGAGTLMGDWSFRTWGMMGPRGMMEDWGYSYTPAPLGWVGMIFMWLIPVGLMVLAVFGIVWLVRNVSSFKSPSSKRK
ncbi:MAG TPA: hypothetical protein VFS61_04610 [Anaerolineales bacterium]|nr:hypothetical protein [Anaerolineales bacterium]